MSGGEAQPENHAPAMGFNLPEPILAVLPTDPFDQLDVARRITSIALCTRLASFEEEVEALRGAVARRDDLIADLRARAESSEAAAGDLSAQLARAKEEKETLLNENAALSDMVKKLNRDVSKLEVFKKSLMQSLQEESESAQVGASKITQMQISKASSLSSGSPMGGKDSSNPPPVFPTVSKNDDDFSDNDSFKLGTLRRLDLSSLSGTPRLTPPGSPPRLATGVTPKRLSRPLSPRRHSISVATTKNMSDSRSGIFSSIPPTHSNSMTSPFDSNEPSGRSRVDGKEFFRQVRNRLSYEQFNAFLSNVKELNSQKQTRGETLRRADEIFGPENKDLFTIFDGLINRNLH